MKQSRSSTSRRIPRKRIPFGKKGKKQWGRENSKENSQPKKDRNEETIERASTIKIGSSGNEFDFVDTVSSQPIYTWTALTPTPIQQANVQYNTTSSNARFPSLKHLCALELTRNVALIDWKLLDVAPWSIWKLVWKYILKFGQDSPETFAKFAKKFHDIDSFKAHRLPLDNRNDVRNELVLANSVPGNRLHRFETIFKNISFDDMIRFIYMWNPLVILDLSLIKIPRDDYFTIFSIRDLVALNLCNHEIDNTFVGGLCSSMKSGKLGKLKILKINNTRITQNGLLDLFKLSKSSNTVGTGMASLVCIETDIPMPLDRDNYVTGTKWVKLDKSKHSLIHKLPLGLKLSTLIRKDIIVADDINITSDMILDIVMVDNVANDKYTTRVRIDDAWETRAELSGRVYFGETYILDQKALKEEEEKEEEREEGKGEGKGKGKEFLNQGVSSKYQPRKKQKRVQLNVKDFFCL